MDEQIKRLKMWMNGEKPGPYSLELYTDIGCNLFCKFCDPDPRPLKHLNFEVAYKLLEDAKDMNVKVVRVIGVGDPFMKRQKMMDLLIKIKDYGFFGYVVTNGSLFKEEDIKNLVKIKWDELRISLHGPNKNIHDYLTGKKGTFDIVKKNLEIFQKYKKEYNSEFPRIRINYVLNKKNYSSIDKMASLCEKLGCDLVILPLETPNLEHHKYLKDLVLLDDDIKKYDLEILKILKKFEKSNIELLVPMRECQPMIDKKLTDSKNLEKKFKKISYSSNNKEEKKDNEEKSENIRFINSACFDPWLNLTIKDFDNFGVCCPSVSYATSKSSKAKKEKTYNSLKKIWYGDYYKNIRKNILNGNM